MKENVALVGWQWQGKAEALLQTVVPMPFSLPQISHELTWDRSCAPRDDKPAVNRPRHGPVRSGPVRSAAFCDNSNAAHNFTARLADISLSRDPVPKEHLN
jgi:hypothetical protein